jgi:hypothetical protein
MLCSALMPASVRAVAASTVDGWAAETPVDSSKAPTVSGTACAATRLNLTIDFSL